MPIKSKKTLKFVSEKSKTNYFCDIPKIFWKTQAPKFSENVFTHSDRNEDCVLEIGLRSFYLIQNLHFVTSSESLVVL